MLTAGGEKNKWKVASVTSKQQQLRGGASRRRRAPPGAAAGHGQNVVQKDDHGQNVVQKDYGYGLARSRAPPGVPGPADTLMIQGRLTSQMRRMQKEDSSRAYMRSPLRGTDQGTIGVVRSGKWSGGTVCFYSQAGNVHPAVAKSRNHSAESRLCLGVRKDGAQSASSFCGQGLLLRSPAQRESRDKSHCWLAFVAILNSVLASHPRSSCGWRRWEA